MSGVAMDDVDEEEVVFDQTTLLTRRYKPTSHHQEKSGRCMRISQTILLCCAFFGLGLCIAMPGPTLLDLEARTNTNTSRISQIFTGRSVGYLFGSIVSGFLYDRVNQNCLISFSLIVTAVGTALAPWSKNFTLLMVFIALQGISMGFLDTGGNVYCMTIWGRNSPPYMQALHFSFGLGAFVAPLLAEPFLSKATNMTAQLPYTHLSQIISDNDDSNNNNNAGGVSEKTVQRFIRDAPDMVEVPVTSPSTPPNVDKDRPRKPSAANGDYRDKNPKVADGSRAASIIKKIPFVPPSTTTVAPSPRKPIAGGADFLDKNPKIADGSRDAGIIKKIPAASLSMTTVGPPARKPIAASADFLDKNPKIADGSKATSIIKKIPAALLSTTTVAPSSRKPIDASADFLDKNPKIADGSKAASIIKKIPAASLSTTTVAPSPRKPIDASADFLDKNPKIADGSKAASIIKKIPAASLSTTTVAPSPRKPIDASADFLDKNPKIADGSKAASIIKKIPLVPLFKTTVAVAASPAPDGGESDKTVQRFIRAMPDVVGAPVTSPSTSPNVDKDRPKKPSAASADFLDNNPKVADGSKAARIIKKIPAVTPSSTTVAPPQVTDGRNMTDNNTEVIPQHTLPTTTLPTTLPTTTTTRATTTTRPTTTTTKPTTTNVAKKTQENAVSKSTAKNPSARSAYSLEGNSTDSNETDSGSGNSPSQIIGRVRDVIQNLTNIQFAYLAIAAYLVVLALCFMLMCCCSRQGIRAMKNQDISESEYMIHKETKGFRVQILILMFFFYFLYVGMEVTYGGLIMTFAVKYLAWTKAEGTLLTSVFWGSFALARGISIFFGVCLSPALMLIGDLVMTCLSLAGLVMALDSNHIILWFCTAVLGAGMASIFPTGITWAERYMRMTGKATSVLVVGSALGEMFMPALTGYLFETKGPMWLLYIMLGAGLLSAVLYIIMQNLASNKGERYEKLTQWLGSSSTDSGTEDMDMEMDSLASNSTTNLLEMVSPTSNGNNGKKRVSFNLPKDINPKSIANKYRPSFLGKNSAKRD